MAISQFTFFIISDVHNDAEAFGKVLVMAKDAKAAKILVAGDLCPRSWDLVEKAKNTSIPLVIVRGNSDSMWDWSEWELSLPPITRMETFQGHTIGMTHGHIISSFQDFPYAFKDGDIFISGHTHIPVLEKIPNGPYIVNPGSISEPRGKQGPTYVELTASGLSLCSLCGKRLKTLVFSAS